MIQKVVFSPGHVPTGGMTTFAVSHGGGIIMQKNSRLKGFASRLLATTCLTAATGAAAFGSTLVLTEGAQGSIGTEVVAPAGTTEVDGVVSLNHGPNGDFFELTGLPASVSFSSLSLTVTNVSGPSLGAAFYNDTPAEIVSLTTVDNGTPYDPSGTVPADGNLIVNIRPSNEGATDYTVTLDLPTGTPEPGTLGALGLGLAGIAGLGLRRRTQKS
jgi:hypothetical protein